MPRGGGLLTIFLLLLLLGRDQALAELLLAFVEFGCAIRADVAQGWGSNRALCGGSSDKRA
jgi:hypothetical protein